MIHDFYTCLKRSHAYSEASWWQQVYNNAFGECKLTSINEDGWLQRNGIDRLVEIKGGRVVSIDEKVREKDWNDILLERWSNRERKTPGWVQKPLRCDFIAYAFAPSQTCYLLPFLTLRTVWARNGREWIRKYPKILARNYNYTTECIAIPIDILMKKLGDAMKVEWE